MAMIMFDLWILQAAFSTGLITLYQDTLPIFTIPE